MISSFLPQLGKRTLGELQIIFVNPRIIILGIAFPTNRESFKTSSSNNNNLIFNMILMLSTIYGRIRGSLGTKMEKVTNPFVTLVEKYRRLKITLVKFQILNIQDRANR